MWPMQTILRFDNLFFFSDDNQVFGWGNNEYGQLGVSIDDPQVSTPVPLDLSDLDGQLISMATGGAFTAFLTSKHHIDAIFDDKY